MFTPITLTGRVTADLELQTSQNNTEYVQFNVAVNKGSLLFITDDLDLVEFTRKSDNSKDIIPKIIVYEWSYVPGGKRAENSNANTGSGAPASASADDGFMNVEDCGENGLPLN